MKGFILKSHEAQALSAGKPVVIWRACKPQPSDYINKARNPHPDPTRQKKKERPYFDAYRNKPHTPSNPGGMSEHWCWWDEWDRQGPDWIKSPFGIPGVPMFGKETWCEASPEHRDHPNAPKAFYKAGKYSVEGEEIRQEYIRLGHDYTWKPSTSMPEWASRITLTLSDVKVRRPCDVTEEEVKEMGILKYSWLATTLNPDTMKLVTDDRHCRRVFGEIFRTQYGDAAWKLYHFTAMATPQPKNS